MIDDVTHALIAARTLIADKADWSRQYAFADRRGRWCVAARAERWSEMGALGASGAPWSIVHDALDALGDVAMAKRQCRGLSRDKAIVRVTDLGHAAVVSMYDEAIARRLAQ